MKKALYNTPIEDFKIPEEVVEVSIDTESGMLATQECKNIKKENFLLESAPTEPCNQHQPQVQKFLQADLSGELDMISDSLLTTTKTSKDFYAFD